MWCSPSRPVGTCPVDQLLIVILLGELHVRRPRLAERVVAGVSSASPRYVCFSPKCLCDTEKRAGAQHVDPVMRCQLKIVGGIDMLQDSRRSGGTNPVPSYWELPRVRAHRSLRRDYNEHMPDDRRRNE